MDEIVEYKPEYNIRDVSEAPFTNYLLVLNTKSGRSWAMKIEDHNTLDLQVEVRRFITSQFGKDLQVEPSFSSDTITGKFKATIITDGRPPSTNTIWSDGSFWLQSTVTK
jgi:hypothetical protein